MAKTLLTSNVLFLRDLDLFNNQIGAVGTVALAEALEKNATLRNLDLSYNAIGDLGAQALAIALTKNVTLRVLNVADNRIGIAGAQALANSLQINSILIKLSLSANQIRKVGAQKLELALQNNTTLTILVLGRCGAPYKEMQRIDALLTRNELLVELGDKKTFLESDREIALATRAIQMPIYVLLDIVDWKHALQASNIELEWVGQCFHSERDHQRRFELLHHRNDRIRTVEFICKMAASLRQ